MKINLNEAITQLNQGKLIAVPTETVYGLAASLKHEEALKNIFALKGRPVNNPLIVHLSSGDQLEKYIHTKPPHTQQLIETFWPGPLTLILEAKRDQISSTVRAELPTAAFRVPSHPLALQLLQQIDAPLAMPSANRSGRPSATSRLHVEEDFGKDFPVLDGGECSRGLESTILGFIDNKWQIARLGALTREEIGKILGYLPEIVQGKNERPICPGQLYRHYAPKAHLTFNSEEIDQVDVVLGFAERKYLDAKKVFLLGSLHNPAEVAEKLYTLLRRLDQENIRTAWIDMSFPEEGLWKTIRERLQRAQG